MKNFNHRGHREHGGMKRKLREFAGGYMNTSEGVVKERSVGAHLNRHAGAYVGTVLAPVLGTGIGALIDAARKKSSLIKTADENAVSARTAAALGGINRNLSADLKPALRELAARSEKLTEFAMVRDANGQFVEVDDKGGMGVGTALKVGAGAAALGGAGYGGVKAYQYGKKQIVGQGFDQYRAGLNGSMPADFAKKAAEEDFARLGKLGGAKAAFGVTGRAGLNAAKASGVGKGLRGALLGAAKWLKPVAAVV
jgi:hypothetical protein